MTTHRHQDHWRALAEVHRATGAQLVAGDPDAAAIASGAGVPLPDGVWDGDRLDLGDASLEVIGLVGHTPGSIVLVVDDGTRPARLLTGDALFPGGPGRTTGPDDFKQLMDDLESKNFDVYDDTVVHPGHGDSTTLRVERPHLAEWRNCGW